MNRRAILRGTLGSLAGLTLPTLARFGFSQELPAAAPTLVSVTDGFVMLTGAGGNILVRTSESGQVLVDSGTSGSVQSVLGALNGLPGGGRIRTLFNTHWHLDQVGGNLVLGRSGAAIVAHEKTAVRLATNYYLGVENRYELAQPAEARPTETFFSGGETLIDDERVEYAHLLQAHTDGDIYVYFRDANVLAAGDAVAPVRDPELDWFGGGWLGGRVEAQQLLLELCDTATRIVPAYGPVMNRTQLQTEHEMSLVLFDRIMEYVRLGMSARDMLEEGLMDGIDRTFNDPYRFAYAAHKGFWAHHNSLEPDVL